MILCCMAVCSHPVEALVTQGAGPLRACGADEKYGGMVRSRVWGSGFRASSKRVEVPNVPGERSLLQEGWRQCATEEHELFETCEKVLTSRLCGFGKPCPNCIGHSVRRFWSLKRSPRFQPQHSKRCRRTRERKGSG